MAEALAERFGASATEGSPRLPRALRDPGGLLTLEEVEQLALRAGALGTPDSLGLELGAALPVTVHGPLGFAVLSASDVRGALRAVTTYFAILTPLFTVVEMAEGARTTLRLAPRWRLHPDAERFHTATMCGALYGGLSRVRGGAWLTGVTLRARHPRPVLPAWVDDLGIELQFDAEAHELAIPTALLDLPLPLADGLAHRDALRRCEALLESQPDPEHTSRRVRLMLVERGPPFPSLEDISKRLSVTGRTLRRRLAVEGTSFRRLCEAARLTLADRWLIESDRSITAIGLDLGYADAANFTRAYRRARGHPPRATRGTRGPGARRA